MDEARCRICGAEGTAHGPKPMDKVPLCGRCRRAWDESGERARWKAIDESEPVRLAVSFVDFLNRTLSERRNHGNAVGGVTP